MKIQKQIIWIAVAISVLLLCGIGLLLCYLRNREEPHLRLEYVRQYLADEKEVAHSVTCGGQSHSVRDDLLIQLLHLDAWENADPVSDFSHKAELRLGEAYGIYFSDAIACVYYENGNPLAEREAWFSIPEDALSNLRQYLFEELSDINAHPYGEPFRRSYNGHSALVATDQPGENVAILLDGRMDDENVFRGTITIGNSMKTVFGQADCRIYPDEAKGIYWVCDDYQENGTYVTEPAKYAHAYGILLADAQWENIAFLHLDSTPDGQWEDMRRVYTSAATNAQSAIEKAAALAQDTFYMDTWFFGESWEWFEQTYSGYRWFKNDGGADPGEEVTIMLKGKKNVDDSFAGSLMVTAGDEVIYTLEHFYLCFEELEEYGTYFSAQSVDSMIVQNLGSALSLGGMLTVDTFGYMLADEDLENFTFWLQMSMMPSVAYTTNVSSRSEAVAWTENKAKESPFFGDSW